MFEFYLIGSELAFRRDRQVVFQTQLLKSQTAVPLTRNYLLDNLEHIIEQSVPEPSWKI
jgi:cyclopropane-fatty-acyl-phospholipid synthase